MAHFKNGKRYDGDSTITTGTLSNGVQWVKQTVNGIVIKEVYKVPANVWIDKSSFSWGEYRVDAGTTVSLSATGNNHITFQPGDAWNTSYTTQGRIITGGQKKSELDISFDGTIVIGGAVFVLKQTYGYPSYQYGVSTGWACNSVSIEGASNANIKFNRETILTKL